MNIGDYKFNVGDEVVNIDGERGEIVFICECGGCQKRGFHEPVWRNNYDDDEDYISDIEAKRGFPRYYKIGDYYFNKFQRDWVEECIWSKEDQLAKLREQLRLINEIENNKED